MAESKTPGEALARRQTWPVRKLHLHDDHEQFDADQWAAIEPSARADYVFELSALMAQLKGFDGDQLRVQRTLTSIKRAKR